VTAQLAEMLVVGGRLDEAFEQTLACEALALQLGDKLTLGLAKCVRGKIAVGLGDRGAAQAALAEAEAAAASIGAEPASSLQQRIDQLRAALAPQGLPAPG
jgi:hypothetical protein